MNIAFSLKITFQKNIYIEFLFADVNVVNGVPYGGVMVWASISYGQ
jgi:hypothetical protein